MALTATEKDQVWRAFMRLINAEPSPFIKSVLRTAIDDADTWAESNATAFNTALNATFRTNATAAQKAAVLALVCWWRAGRNVPEGF